jgi:hypothetical protein
MRTLAQRIRPIAFPFSRNERKERTTERLFIRVTRAEQPYRFAVLTCSSAVCLLLHTYAYARRDASDMPVS